MNSETGVWALAGPVAWQFGLVDEYLAYLADRIYSPKTARAYGYDLLAFCRWLVVEEQSLTGVTTEVLLGFLRRSAHTKPHAERRFDAKARSRVRSRPDH